MLKTYKIFFLALFSVWRLNLIAQGLLLDDAVYNSLPRQPLYGDGGKSEADALKGIFKIDLRPFCPKPKNQGKHGSCTSWATGYAAMSASYAIQAGLEGERDSITKNAFSALFLYNQIREDFSDCGQGTYIHNALKLLKETGNISHAAFDGGNNCKRKPTVEELESAGEYRIKDWLTLFESGSSARIRIDKTKLSLADKKPVIIAMRTRNNFSELGPADKYWLPTVGDTALSFFHAMLVVGFDDGKGAFEVMNSWGESWGNKGFFWIRYDDYAKHVPNAYQLTLFPQGTKQKNNTNRPLPTLSAQFSVRAPTSVVAGEMQFENIPFTLEKEQYTPQNPPWPTGKRYQLVAEKISGGTYLYAFSLDARQRLRVHWPRDGALDSKFDGINESAVISNDKVRLIIPDPLKVLVLEEPGTEYLCLLLSPSPLADLNAILERIQADKNADLAIRLKNALGDRLLKSSQVKRSKDGIAIEMTGQVNGVGAVLLKIPVDYSSRR